MNEIGLTRVERLRRRVITVFSIIGTPYLSVIGIINILSGRVVIGIVDIAIALLFLFNAYLCYRRSRIELAGTILLGILFLFFLYIFYEGGYRGTGHFWIYSFVIASFLFKGPQRGIRYAGAFFAGLCIFYVLSLANVLRLPRQPQQTLVFLLSYSLVAVLVYYYEVTRYRYEQENLAKTQELEHLSAYDSLTGLYNRRVIMERLGSEIRRYQRYGEPLSILLLDVDHFKQVNDTHGHQCGDAVLKDIIASTLKNGIRDTDIVGRYGGEEFLLVLPSTDRDGALVVAERLRERVSEARVVDAFCDASLAVTVSIGLAAMADNLSQERLIHAADTALYRAKENGRNRVETG